MKFSFMGKIMKNPKPHVDVTANQESSIAAAQISPKFTERTTTRRKAPRSTDIISERRGRIAELEFMLLMMKIGIGIGA